MFHDVLSQEHNQARDEIVADMNMIKEDEMEGVRETIANEDVDHVRELIGDLDLTEYTAYCVFNQPYRDNAAYRARLIGMTVRYLLNQELRRLELEEEVESGGSEEHNGADESGDQSYEEL